MPLTGNHKGENLDTSLQPGIEIHAPKFTRHQEIYETEHGNDITQNHREYPNQGIDRHLQILNYLPPVFGH